MLHRRFPMSIEHFDVLVIGAGISGIGAGYHLQTECPNRTYAILEGRDTLGGTWDLFPLPGHPLRLGHVHARLFLPPLDEPQGDRGRSCDLASTCAKRRRRTASTDASATATA